MFKFAIKDRDQIEKIGEQIQEELLQYLVNREWLRELKVSHINGIAVQARMIAYHAILNSTLVKNANGESKTLSVTQQQRDA